MRFRYWYWFLGGFRDLGWNGGEGMVDPEFMRDMSLGDFKVNIEAGEQQEWAMAREEWVRVTKEWYAKAEDLYASVYKKIAHAYSVETCSIVFESILYDIIYLETKLRIDQFLRVLNSHGLLDDKKFVDFILKYQLDMMEGVV